MYLALAMITVGSTTVASKLIGQGLSPVVATALRFSLAFPIFLVLMRLTRSKLTIAGWRDGLLLLAQGAAGSVGYSILLIGGLQHTTATDAGLILGLLPGASALLSMTFLRERTSRLVPVAAGLATLGVLLASVGTISSGAAHRTLEGDVMVFGAVVCESAFILLNKRLRQPLAPLVQSTVMSGLGLCLTLPFAASTLKHDVQMAGSEPLLGVLYYAIVPTVAGFWLWYAGSSRVSGSEAAVFTALAPLSSAALAYLFLHEPPTPARVAGLILVVSAILLLGLKKPFEKDRRQDPARVPGESGRQC
ncbi:membrane protein [Dyella mobilis]|nr:membrane protein [Dyella mobilis]